MKLKEGDKIPSSAIFYLDEDKKVVKVNLNSIIKKQKVIIFGLPGAFTSICSAIHLPSFLKNFDKAKKKGISKIICISVNDPFVMNAWGNSHNVGDKILMVADPYCEFIKEIGAEVDKSAKGLGIRSSRFTMLIENEIVRKLSEEDDTGKCEISEAYNFLNNI